MKLGRFHAGAVAILMSAVSTSAWGQQMVTLAFDGQITYFYDPGYVLTDFVRESNCLHVTYRYDSASQDLNPADPGRGEYLSPYALLDMSIGRLPITISGAGTKAIVVDGGPGQMDGLAINATSAFVVDQIEILDVLLYAKDVTGSALLSDALPVAPLNPSSFGERRWLLQGRQKGNYFTVSGTWTVPEPLTIVLLLPALCLVRNRRTGRLSYLN